MEDRGGERKRGGNKEREKQGKIDRGRKRWIDKRDIVRTGE